MRWSVCVVLLGFGCSGSEPPPGSTAPRCGDGVVNVGELCDGGVLGGTDCLTLGFVGGTLACRADCSGFDTSACLEACGNGSIDPGEVCDGQDTGGADCISLSFVSGTLGCLADCTDFDTSACVPDPCGNNAIDLGETCDGTDLGGATCEDQGLVSGSLACLGDCSGLDTSACLPPPCGNAQIDAGESCDGANLNGQSCATQGFASGTLGCAGDCLAFDTSACSNGTVITQCAVLPPAAEPCELTAGMGGLLIRGTILLPGEVLSGGEVLVDAAGIISCVGCDCTAQAGSAGVLSCPGAVVSPGLINSHDHLTFAQNQPYTDTGERYEHRHEWRKGLNGHTQIPSGGSATADEMRWGELRFLLAGATSTVGAGGQSGFLRNLDVGTQQEGLSQGVVANATFPLDDNSGITRTADCDYGSAPDTSQYVAGVPAYQAHVAEGINAAARNEFRCLTSTTYDTTAVTGGGGTSDDLALANAAFVHGAALLAPDLVELATSGTALVWSPRSNITLYGDTAPVVTASRLGVLLTLGSDWVITGSMNLLRELKCADALDTNYYGNFFSDEDLWRMVTVNPAVATRTDDAVGRLAPGLFADISIFRADQTRPNYRAVIDAEAEDVVLVLRGGAALYGDALLVETLSGSNCDPLTVCGTGKRVCSTSQIGKTLGDLTLAVGSGAYPAFFCDPPLYEPTCVPSRGVSVSGSTVYTGLPSAGDADGDGIPDASDNCAGIFNPVRPVDAGAQADVDNDGAGDACDVCPLDAGSAVCSPIDPYDPDGDGVGLGDNCPDVQNTDQADQDSDQKGDACDPCPTDANPGNAGCPVTIYAIKNGTVAPGAAVALSGVLVTGRNNNGFFAQVKEGDPGYQGADYSGIFVFSSTNTVAVGDRVTVGRATVQDFFGQIQLSGVSGVTVISSGEPAPAATATLAADVQTGGTRAAALEAVVVRVDDVQVTGINPAPRGGDTAPNNEFVVDEVTTGGVEALRVNDYLYRLAPFTAVGEHFLSLTGILEFRNGDSKVELRSLADAVPGSATVVSFAPALSYLREGATASPTIPQPLTVSLQRAMTTDTLVTLVASNPSLVGVPGGGVSVPAGQTSAVVLIDGMAPGTVTLTASYNSVDHVADVRVVGSTEQPRLIGLQPANATLSAGGQLTLTASLDIPALSGPSIDVALNPANAGTLPASVVVPDDQLQVNFDYVDGGLASQVTVTATLGTDSYNSVLSMASGGLVINEMDYDQMGNDTGEFIELYNGSNVAVSLQSLVLVFVNGATNAEYAANSRVALSAAGASIAPGQYLVVGTTPVVNNLPAGVLAITFALAQDNIQNGAPDGVALIDTAATAVLDAFSYEGPITAANITGFGSTVNLVEGTVLPSSVADSNAAVGALIRSPNGTDSDNAATDWVFTSTPTPGAANP